jgi:hypothetical protein
MMAVARYVSSRRNKPRHARVRAAVRRAVQVLRVNLPDAASRAALLSHAFVAWCAAAPRC